MLFELEHGPKAAQLATLATRMGQAVPEEIAEAPSIPPGCELFMTAFWQLSTCRPASGALIPWTVIHQWCAAHDIHGEQAEDIYEVVRALDFAWLEWKAKGGGRGE